MSKFLKYSSTDFLNEDSFIKWIMEPDNPEESFWSKFLEENPSKRDEVEEAIEIFNHFKFVHEELTLEETFELWNNIKHNSVRKRNRFSTLLKYAAIFILVFTTGALSYYLYNTTQTNEFTISENVPVDFDEAQVILSDGKSVPLHSKDSEIRYNATGEEIIIDDDTISQQNQTSSELNRVIIPYGKSSQLTLSDGTKVWLNAGSQLMYPSVFEKKQREVLLVGEAFFDVVRNENSPFVVRTEHADVEVLGTSFDILAYPDDNSFRTILVTGSVKVETKREGILAGKNKNILTPNEMLILDKVSGDSYVKKVDVSGYTSWKDGMFHCDKIELNRIVRKLERYYNKKIHIKDPMLGGYKISGKLDLKNDLSEVLEVMQIFVPIDWGKQNNGDYFIVKPN